MTGPSADGTAHGIPKVIHRIWLGERMPPSVADLGRAWRDRHPGWLVHTWREWDLPALENQRWFDAASSPAQQADIARLELLHRYGGVYVDTDYEPLRPLDGLLAGTRCFFGSEDDQWLATAVMGSIPGHPFLSDLIDGLPGSILGNRDAPPNQQTGPKYVTARYRAYAAVRSNDPVVVFPASMFYPYHFSEPERRSESFPEAFGVHHWRHSWNPAGDAA